MKNNPLNHHYNHAKLCDFIYQKIINTPDQRITFAEYMNWVLYHPEYGYYETHATHLGKQGDFFTAVHLGPDFGELLAEQFVQMWSILGNPVPFSLVEMGAGQGILASDILTYIKTKYPQFFRVLDYIIIEKSSALRQEQQQRLQMFNIPEKNSVYWYDWEEMSNDSITGCFFSNELVDAFPVHQIIIEDNTIKEIYVTAYLTQSDPIQLEFREIIDLPSTPQLSAYFDLIHVEITSPHYENGYRTEVNLDALDWLKTVATKLKTGYLLTIDYGYPAHRYYHPRRREGTLQCYYRHQRHNNPYSYIGYQDLTTHVDFTALEKQGELLGLNQMGWTQQALFLMALGLGDRMAALSSPSLNESEDQSVDPMTILRRRDAFHQLIDPMGLGGFGVLIQSQGLSPKALGMPLKGLQVPESLFSESW